MLDFLADRHRRKPFELQRDYPKVKANDLKIIKYRSYEAVALSKLMTLSEHLGVLREVKAIIRESPS